MVDAFRRLKKFDSADGMITAKTVALHAFAYGIYAISIWLFYISNNLLNLPEFWITVIVEVTIFLNFVGYLMIIFILNNIVEWQYLYLRAAEDIWEDVPEQV